MTELFKIVQTYLDEHGTKEAAFARLIGMSPQNLNGLKRQVKRLPDRRRLSP